MTDKELVKSTFSEIHVPDAIKAHILQMGSIAEPRKKAWRFVPVVVCIMLVFALGGFAYAIVRYWGVGVVGDTDRSAIMNPFGTVASGEADVKDSQDSSGQKSGIIKNYDNIFAASAINFELTSNEIPSLYFSPGYMVVFTRGNEMGWRLKTGDQLAVNYTLDDQSLVLETGYVLNGEYYKLGEEKGADFADTITAAEDGVYYFCITNHSSANAIIKRGTVDLQVK